MVDKGVEMENKDVIEVKDDEGVQEEGKTNDEEGMAMQGVHKERNLGMQLKANKHLEILWR